jgi:phage gpG-like protein
LTNPITIHVTGSDTLSPQLHRFGQLLSDAGKVRLLEAVADKLLRITWENFGENGKNRPIEWPALSPRYQRSIGYFGPPKLILEGDLINSVRTLGMGDNWVEIGSDLPYASIHQNGEGVVPARPYFPVTSDDELTPFADAEVRRVIEAEISQMMGV